MTRRRAAGVASRLAALAAVCALASCAALGPDAGASADAVAARTAGEPGAGATVADAAPPRTAPPGAWAAAQPALGPAGVFGAAAAREAGGSDADAPRRPGVDPLEPLNRAVFGFNQVLDDWLLRPVARTYDRFAPEVVRLIAGNVFSNLLDPWIGVNNLLQGKPTAAASDFGRFLFNSTLGFFGFADPASDFGLRKNREDFGQTLGAWGLPTGPYLVLPVFGPSNFRDGTGFFVDSLFAPVTRVNNVDLRNTLVATQFVEFRAQLLPAERLLNDALDRYLLIRDTYLQRRRNLVYDGNPPDDPDADTYSE